MGEEISLTDYTLLQYYTQIYWTLYNNQFFPYGNGTENTWMQRLRGMDQYSCPCMFGRYF